MVDNMIPNTTTPNTMMPNEDTLKKFTGNVAYEVPQAAYRLGATLLVRAVQNKAVLQLKGSGHSQIAGILNGDVGEAIVGFALAAILEFVPMHSLGDTPKTLAFNLRVRSYEELGEQFLNSTGFLGLITGGIEDEIVRAMSMAGVELKPTVQPAAKANGAAGAGVVPDSAGVVGGD